MWAFTVEIAAGDGGAVHLFGFDTDTSLMRPWDLLMRVIEFISRSLLTAVVFAHIFLQVNRMNWHAARDFAGTADQHEYDAVMAELDGVLARP